MARSRSAFSGVVEQGAGLLHLLHVDVAVTFFGSRVLVAGLVERCLVLFGRPVGDLISVGQRDLLVDLGRLRFVVFDAVFGPSSSSLIVVPVRVARGAEASRVSPYLAGAAAPFRATRHQRATSAPSAGRLGAC